MKNNEKAIRAIRESIVRLNEVEGEIETNDKILSSAIDVVHGAAYISGILDINLDLNDPKDKLVATAKCMLEELTKNFWLECSENAVDSNDLVNPNFEPSKMWNTVSGRLVTNNGKIAFV